MKGYIYIFGTILFTVYGQIIIKWRLGLRGGMPDDSLGKLKFLALAFLDPLLFTGFLSAFIASVFWMAAMTKFEITYAYPFMSIAPALVFIVGILVLGETFTMGKLLGLVIIIIGIIVTVKF